MSISFSVEAARQAIEESMAGALKKAQVPRSGVLSLCLAGSGVDRQSDIDSYRMWIRCDAPLCWHVRPRIITLQHMREAHCG